MAEAPKEELAAGSSKKESRHVVAIAELKVSAIYDHESEKAGLPGFWKATVIAYMGGTVLKADATARGYNRAMSMALLDIGHAGLREFRSKEVPHDPSV